MHDGLCQTLAGIAALSATLARRLAANADPTLSAAAAEITHLVNDTIGQAGDLARGLDPVGLRGGTLDEALEGLALDTTHRFRVSCTFACDHAMPRLPHEDKMHLFRIAQEAVSNAVRHGRADHVDICLNRKDGVLRIHDNGVGLTEKAGNEGGAGLHTMAYRARLLNGSLAIHGRPGGGTSVTCTYRVAVARLPVGPDTPEPSGHVRRPR